MFKEGLLEGKRILVTGGGTGLGKELATRYLSLGAEIWIAGRRGPVLDATAKEMMTAHGELDGMTDADWERARALIKAQDEKDRSGRTA